MNAKIIQLWFNLPGCIAGGLNETAAFIAQITQSNTIIANKRIVVVH